MNDPSDQEQNQKRGDSQNSDYFFNRERDNNERDSVDTNELLKESDDDDEDNEVIQLTNDDTNTSSNNNNDALSNRSLESAEIENIRDSLSTIQDEDEERQSSSTTPTTRSSQSSSKTKKIIALVTVNNQKTHRDDDNPVIPDETLIDTSDLKDMEPKLRQAYIQMRRLDLRLQEVLKLERQTKRETQALIERNRASLELLRLSSDHKETPQEAKNTAQFLQLGYITASLNSIEEDGGNDESRSTSTTEREYTPLFKTQLDDHERRSSSQSDSKPKQQNDKKPSVMSFSTTTQTQNSHKSSSAGIFGKTTAPSSTTNGSSLSKKKDERDFIKRNIKLAQDAGEMIAMTDEEKQRLNELLLTEELQATTEGIIEDLVEYNPYSVSLPHGEGFTPERVELERLREIDARVEKTLSCTSFTTSRRNSFMSNNNCNSEVLVECSEAAPRQINLNEEHFDENEFGDKFIREARVSREQEQRLKLIDAQLEALKKRTSELEKNNTYEDDEASSDISVKSVSATYVVPLIDEGTLKLLLEECAMSLKDDRSTSTNKKLGVLLEETENSQSDIASSTSEISLNETTLKFLLSQAKQEGIIATNEEDDGGTASPPLRAFYEEALEIIRNRPAILLENVSKDMQIEDEQRPGSLKKRQPLLESRLVNINRLSNDDRSVAAEQPSSRPTSSSSTASSTISFLPKIDCRFLQQK